MSAAAVAAGTIERPVFRGHAALNRLGVRAIWMYVGAGGIAVLVQGGELGRAQRGSDWLELTGLLVLLAVTAGLAVAACTWARTDLLLLAVAGNTLTTAVVVELAAHWHWPPPALLTSTIATGATVGLALSRRPLAGLSAAAAAVAAMSLAANRTGMPIPIVDLIAVPTSTSVASIIAVMAGRGFAETEEALRGVDDALAMERVADARWQAGQRADREVHDTVLTTLTLLSHRDFQVEPEPVRELCRRDLAFLEQRSWRTDEEVETPRTPPGGQAMFSWAVLGLQVHRLGAVAELAGLDPPTWTALESAVRECLLNVSRHSGADAAQVVISRRDDTLVVLVVDEGRGFDPAQVPPDRLGLAQSVRGRITDVGGSVTVWSRPGAGTTVLLGVPIEPAADLPAAVDVRAAADAADV